MTGPFVIVLVAGIALVGTVAWRERRAARAARGRLLDDCLALFDHVQLSREGDGLPRIEGMIGGSRLIVELVPDTMTVRRLPQLWLSLTMPCAVPLAAGFAVLSRPSGAEFYSLTGRLDHDLRPPAGFPAEVLVRGEAPGAAAALAAAGPAVAGLLADSKVKEVAVTRRGLRVIRQQGEGRRGEHLLLRQAVFDHAAVEPAVLLALHDALREIRTLLAEAAQPRPERGSGRR